MAAYPNGRDPRGLLHPLCVWWRARNDNESPTRREFQFGNATRTDTAQTCQCPVRSRHSAYTAQPQAAALRQAPDRRRGPCALTTVPAPVAGEHRRRDVEEPAGPARSAAHSHGLRTEADSSGYASGQLYIY
eukprot:3989412-Prymnesium_polylepis.1